ncbi:MAG TPA: peptidase M16, partial [Desulfobacteraceae bacterium]|nr:peptidase M16 [Desulfobacteraceae bacterium]
MVTHGFSLLKEQPIAELNLLARLFLHEKTGAQVLSLMADDENKVFGIAFRTPPSDSTGVAHILEHSVLCGSRKYPVKEPFVELLKGSLQTFLNAFTYPDKTCYPVASQNLQDFYNLMDVYLDAVFYPRITRAMFEQEGWHLELEDITRPLSYKGVVFNEMKGAYSSPDSLLSEYSLQSLFPDTAYGLDSGGDPKQIPNLTYEQFRDFHRKFYHPSN